MIVKSSILRATVGCLALSIVFGVVIAGCSGTNGSQHTSGDPVMKTSSDPKMMDADPSPLSASAQKGKKLFDSLGCMGCHTVNGQGGSVGPNLSNEGNSGHSDQWLMTQIRDPKKNDPQTIMPAFDNLTDEQVNELVNYLKSLKKTSAQDSSVAPTPKVGKNTSMSPAASSASVTAGGEMWSKTCGECHNLRPPSEYSDAQWVVAVHHMRVRAPLTGQQEKEILKFLQASN